MDPKLQRRVQRYGWDRRLGFTNVPTRRMDAEALDLPPVSS
jgi:hypothetical protein